MMKRIRINSGYGDKEAEAAGGVAPADDAARHESVPPAGADAADCDPSEAPVESGRGGAHSPADAGETAPDAETLRKRAEEYLDTLRRVQADFDNYRKRARKEKAETIRYANREMILKLLDVLDNLERAVGSAARCDVNSSRCIAPGVEMICRQFGEMLAEYGVAPFRSKDEPFDPARHECVYTLEREDVPENTVVEELQRGYLMHDGVLRAARVAASRKPSAPAPCEAEGAGKPAEARDDE
ncbi:MAG: nucleotide exchange factor GrpE [bacterium]